MRIFITNFLLILGCTQVPTDAYAEVIKNRLAPSVLNTSSKSSGGSGGGVGYKYSTQCAQGNTCPGKTSGIANTVCYSYRRNPGFNYAIITFGNGIAAVCSVDYNCQPDVIAQLTVVDVLGYLVRLVHKFERCDGTYDIGYNLWYIRLIPGCPEYYKIPRSTFNGTGGPNKALYPLPLDDIFAYQAYEQFNRSYEAECNVFQSVPIEDCGCCCSSQNNYGTKQKPIAAIDLSQTTSAYAFSFSNDTVINKFINDYGVLNVSCRQLSKPENGSNPSIYENVCMADGVDTTPQCKDFRNTIQMYDLIQTYNYYVNCLDRKTASKVKTLYAQGINPNNCTNGYSFCNRNTASITTYIQIAFFPRLDDLINFATSADGPNIIYWLFRGYSDIDLSEKLLKKFLSI